MKVEYIVLGGGIGLVISGIGTANMLLALLGAIWAALAVWSLMKDERGE